VGLGASRARAFWAVTLPLIRPGVVAGALFAFIISFNTFTLSYFLYSADAKPLPMWVFEYMAYFLDPTLAALSTLLIALTLVTGGRAGSPGGPPASGDPAVRGPRAGRNP
jgi:ABC-type spermidine/putrescine transport system permease subunit II